MKAPLPRAKLALKDIPASIRKVERRLSELTPSLDLTEPGAVERLVNTINATIETVFGAGTAEAREFNVRGDWFFARSEGRPRTLVRRFGAGLERTKCVLNDAVKRLQEHAADAEEDASSRTLKAYEGLDLHPEIARAASELYSNGHYANAIEDAVKALNAFVRLRSGVDDRDGTDLMEYVFSPKKPVLAFNELRDESDRNEQKGFMMMLSGAVAGLRNPRAHRLVRDDPERALEFIAYVSLLAKLVDEAKRAPAP